MVEARPEIVTLGSRTAAMPSVVFVDTDGSVLVGDAAEARAGEDPTRRPRASSSGAWATRPPALTYPVSITIPTTTSPAGAADGSGSPPIRVCVSHILVATRAEADELTGLLAAGGDFASLALERSTDRGSAVDGGDLGCSDDVEGVFVPEFAAAALDATRRSGGRTCADRLRVPCHSCHGATDRSMSARPSSCGAVVASSACYRLRRNGIAVTGQALGGDADPADVAQRRLAGHLGLGVEALEALEAPVADHDAWRIWSWWIWKS